MRIYRYVKSKHLKVKKKNITFLAYKDHQVYVWKEKKTHSEPSGFRQKKLSTPV